MGSKAAALSKFGFFCTNGQTPAAYFSFIFGLFQTNKQYHFLQQINVKNVHPVTALGFLPTISCWIAEWSSHSTFEHQYTTPWAVSLSLGDVKLFFGPKHNIYALFMILFDLFDLILLFVCQICHVNCEAEN